MKNASFSREHRLLNKNDFSSVFSSARGAGKGRLIRFKGYAVYQKFTDEVPRLGLSVPKKLVRRANKRNRVKRVLREFFRLNRDRLSGDIVIRVTSEPLSFDFKTLVGGFDRLFESRIPETIKIESSDHVES